MRNIWRYLLIIFGVLVVLSLLAIPFLGRFGMMNGGRWIMGGGRGMMDGYGFHMRGFGGGMMGFGLFGSLLRGLFTLALLVLVGWGIYTLVRRASFTHPMGHGMPAAQVTESAIPCPHCGRYIQRNWVACPYCGEKAVEPVVPPVEPPVVPPPQI